MTLALQYERLRRHFEVASRTFDKISFLDLSHTLRVWAVARETIRETAPEFSASSGFKIRLPARRALRVFSVHEYVYALFADSVTAHASEGEIARLGDSARKNGGAELFVKFKFSGPSLTIANYCYLKPPIDLPASQLFGAERSDRCTFVQWLHSCAVVGSFPNASGTLQPFTLTREQLIRRVANELDASHPSGFPVPPAAQEASRATHYLLDHTVAGLPLPYLLLLKDASDILDVGRKFLAP